MLRYSSLPIKRVISHSTPSVTLISSRLALSRSNMIPLFNPNFNRWNSSASENSKKDPKTLNASQQSATKVFPVKEKEKLPFKVKMQKALRHYWDGSKLLGLEMKISSKLLMKSAAGYPLTRRENLQLKRTTQDIIRLVPFAAFLIIPFAEFLLPFALKLFPNLLPSTYESSKKRENKLANLRNTRKLMSEIIKNNKPHFKPNNISEEQKALFNRFYTHVRATGVPESRQQLIEVARLFTDDTVLDNVTRPYLIALAKYMNLQPFGTDVMLRYRIRYKMLELKKDDLSIYYEDAEQLSLSELKTACGSRGIRNVDVEPSVLYSNLRLWLNMRLKDKIPSTLLIMATAYNYGNVQSKETLYDALCDVLISIPDELYHEVKVNVVKEDEVSAKQKLKQLREQEEIMKEEEQQEENAIVSVKDELSLDDQDKNMDAAAPEVKPQEVKSTGEGVTAKER